MRDDSPHAPMLVAVVAASVLMHVVLWPVGDELLGWAWGGGALPRTEGIMEVSLLDVAEQPEPEPEIDPDDPENQPEPPGKLVQLDRLEDERSPDRSTPHVSEFDNRSARPTKAPNQQPRPGGPAAGNDGRDGQQDTAPPNPPDRQALPLLPSAAVADTPGSHDAPIDPDERGELDSARGRPPLPSASGSPGARKALLDALGNPGSHDDIDADDGDETSVDSKRWKFASFFNRVRNGIAQRWHPEVVHAANDPDGRRFGTKTRRTRLIISLNPDGSLHRVRLDDACGVDYLDEEAIHAVRTAAPFANPPPGLVDPATGLIEFGFGFIFEFDGGTRIFRYQR